MIKNFYIVRRPIPTRKDTFLITLDLQKEKSSITLESEIGPYEIVRLLNLDLTEDVKYCEALCKLYNLKYQSDYEGMNIKKVRDLRYFDEIGQECIVNIDSLIDFNKRAELHSKSNLGLFKHENTKISATYLNLEGFPEMDTDDELCATIEPYALFKHGLIDSPPDETWHLFVNKETLQVRCFEKPELFIDVYIRNVFNGG